MESNSESWSSKTGFAITKMSLNKNRNLSLTVLEFAT